MLDFLLNIDTAIFYFINITLSNPVFDKLFPYITTNSSWTLVYIILFYILFFKTGRTGKFCALALIITIFVSDQFNSQILKEIFGRLRPCHTLSDINLLVTCGGGKSFPSSHAVNNFAAASVLAYFFKKYRWYVLIIAFLVAFSRVYCGVHYPFDVISGGIIGYFIGLAISVLIEKFNNYLINRKKEKLTS